MTLVAPAALGLLLAAVPIVMFFLRRPSVPSRAVSSLLLARALATLPQRSRRLPREELVPLAMVLTALLLLVTVLTVRPTDSTRPVVVVLDTSETSPLHHAGQSEDLRAQVAALAGQRPEASFSVVTTAPVGVAVAPTRDLDAVLAALVPMDGAGPGGDPGRLVASLCTAQEPTLLVAGAIDLSTVADDCPRIRRSLPPAPSAHLISLVSTAPTSTGDVWLHVHATGAEKAVVETAGTPLGTISLTGSGHKEGLARVTAPPGRPLSVRLEGTDDPTASASLDIPALRPARTLVRTPHPDGYLAKLARVHPRLRPVIVAPTDSAPAGPWDLVLTDAPGPLTDQGTVVAVFGRAAPELGVPGGPVVTRPSLSTAAPDAPVLHLVDIPTLHVQAARTLRAPADATILASTTRGPLALLRPMEAGTAVVFGFGLDQSDLPLRADFVHLVANLVDLAAPAPSAPEPPSTRSPAPVEALAESAAAPTSLSWWWLVSAALLLLGAEGVWLTVRDQRSTA